MSSELIEPALRTTSKSGREEHTPKLGVDVSRSQHYVERAKVARRVGSTVIRGEMGYLESSWEWGVSNVRSKRFKLLIGVLSMDSSFLSLLYH